MAGARSPMGSSAHIDEDERVILTIGGILAAGAVLGSLGLVWHTVVAYLLAHHILVEGAAVLLRLPAAGGAGLDLARLLLGCAGLAACAACAFSVAYRWIRRRSVL